MKPPRFQYFAPDELAEVVQLCSDFEGSHKLLAGGQSLVPALNMRLVRPSQVIDLNRVPGLDDIMNDGEAIQFGALARQGALERSVLVRDELPLLAEAIQYVGHIATRSRGTLVGSICHADPAAEIPTVLTAYGGEVAIASTRGTRIVRDDDFIQSVFTTAIAEDEVATAVRFDKPSEGSGSAFLEVSRRHGDFALASAAVVVSCKDGLIETVRIALGGVAPRPLRATRAEDLLQGTPGSDEALDEAASVVRVDVDPWSDANATAAYRRHVVGILTKRCLVTALERSGGSSRGSVDEAA